MQMDQGSATLSLFQMGLGILERIDCILNDVFTLPKVAMWWSYRGGIPSHTRREISLEPQPAGGDKGAIWCSCPWFPNSNTDTSGQRSKIAFFSDLWTGARFGAKLVRRRWRWRKCVFNSKGRAPTLGESDASGKRQVIMRREKAPGICMARTWSLDLERV